MKLSTLYYFITSVPSKKEVEPNFLEEISLLSFPDVTAYLNSEEKNIRESVIKEIIAKSKQ
ncbi:MAG: hypothetical protein HC905_21825 [Bacteroidales bacterium]|nr:hypothetical protein [Bacteroidales bacterium]